MSNRVSIRGDLETVFRYAAEVERWPEILPHYRSVRIHDGDDTDRTVSMCCVRRFGPVGWPCRWRARQEVDREARTIRYRHLAGPAKGMEVEWSFVASGDDVLTTITHRFAPPWPLVGRIYSDRIVGPLFVGAVADRTLQTIKSLVEGEQ